MTNNHISMTDTSPGIRRRTSKPWVFRFFLLIASLIVGGIGWIGVWVQNNARDTQLDPTVISLATSMAFTPTPSPSLTVSPVMPTNTPAPTRITSLGTIIYSARENGRTHLWNYVSGDSNATQLTGGPWDDRDPAVSPDGLSVAFSSRRNGYWDLYILDLQSGEIRQLSNTPGYEGNPTWSPDGHWLAFEAYYDGNFDIWIVPIDLGQDPIQLTIHPGADQDPSWDPRGRRIAFVSDRDGSPDVFLANLDEPDDRFRNLTNTQSIMERTPVFNADGFSLAYSESFSGIDVVKVFDMNDLDQAPYEVGQGRHAAWSPDNHYMITVLCTGLVRRFHVFALDHTEATDLPLIPGIDVDDVMWTAAGMPGEIYTSQRIQPTDAPIIEDKADESQQDTTRMELADLPGVRAPHPSLSDAVDQDFLALRQRSISVLGWDFLESLDNAFVGLNDPMPPGFAYNDWLYTGRAFTFNSAAIKAGWVEFIREDFGGQTYWRVFVLAALQDGTLGEPLRELPWDFNTRNNGDPVAYDQGGSLFDSIPPGYYVDFTQLAFDYGFERLPALPNWRTYNHGTRLNEFVKRGGLSWADAMLELYPASALVTPTPFQTPTKTPTRTPRPTATSWYWRWRTPSSTPTPQPNYTPTVTP